jgi:hypothetical protein
MAGIEDLLRGEPNSVWYWHWLGLLAGLYSGYATGAGVGAIVQAGFQLFEIRLDRRGTLCGLIGAIGLIVCVIVGTALGVWIGSLMGGWMLLTEALAGLAAYGLPEELPETRPGDVLVVSRRIDEAFGRGVGSVMVNARVFTTMLFSRVGGVIGGLVFRSGEAVASGALLLGLVTRILSFGLLAVVWRFAERRLAGPNPSA